MAPPLRVEPPPAEQHVPLTFALLKSVYSHRVSTVKRLPRGTELLVRDAWIAEVRAVLSAPHDEAVLVRFLLFWLCVAPTFRPRNAWEDREDNRRRMQKAQLLRFLQVWGERDGIFRLLSHLRALHKLEFPRTRRSSRNDQLVAQCQRLAREGRYGAAVEALSSSGLAPPSPETVSQLQQLHPETPLPMRGAVDVPDPVVSPDMLLRAIRTFPHGSAGGRDGMRPQHFLDMISASAAPVAGHTLATLAELVTLMLRDGLHPDAAQYVSSAHLVALPKEKGGVRPIAAGLALRRLVGKAAWRLVHGTVVEHLSPLQLGVGVPKGAEVVIHAVNRYVKDNEDDPDRLLAQIDLTNAFNRVSREAVLEQVAAVCPVIYPWVASTLCCSGLLFFDKHLLYSRAGVQQGDPLGPMLFALAIHPLLLRLAAISQLHVSAWYLDDGTLAGSQAAVTAGLEAIAAAGPALGLHLSREKTRVWWPSFSPSPSTLASFDHLQLPASSVAADGVKVLGSPVSTSPAFRASYVRERIAACTSAMQRLSLLSSPGRPADPQLQLLLLRSCLGSCRMLYLLRTTPPQGVEAMFAEFDVSLRSSLCMILGGEQFVGEFQVALASLPLRLGGLGLTRVADLLHFAFLSSRLDTSLLQQELLSYNSSSPPPPDAQFQAVYNSSLPAIRQYLSDWRTVAASEASSATTQLQPHLAGRYFEDAATGLPERFAVGERMRALLGCLREPAAFQWLLAAPVPNLHQTLPASSYRALLRYRLGMPLFPGGERCLRCSAVMDRYGDHALLCQQHTGTAGFIHRHKQVQLTLSEVLREAGVPHAVEPRGFVLPADGGRGHRPADLLLHAWDGDRHCCVDVVCVSPARQQWKQAGRALRSAEAAKIMRHGGCCKDHHLSFMPFACSAVGGFGKHACELLDQVAVRYTTNNHVTPGQAHDWVYRRVAFAVQRGVAEQFVFRQEHAFGL